MTAFMRKEKPQIRTLVVNNGVIDMSGWHPYDVIAKDDEAGPFVCDYMKNPMLATTAHLTLDVTSRCEDAIEYFQNVMNHVRFKTIELDPSRESTRKRFPWVNPFWDRIRVSTAFGPQMINDDGVYVWFTDFEHHTVRYKDSLQYFDRYTKNHDVVTQSILLFGPLEILTDFENFVKQNSVRVFDSYCYGRSGMFRNGVLNITMEFGTLKNCPAKFRRLKTRGGEYTITGADRQFGDHVSGMLLRSGIHTPRQMYTKERTDIRWVTTARLRWPYYYEALIDICLAIAELGLPVYVILEIVDWLPKMELTNRLKRVRVIEGVKASIERVYAKRKLTKGTNKRTKK